MSIQKGLLIACLALAGCGEKSSAIPEQGATKIASKSYTPCQLMTAEAVQTAFNHGVETIGDDAESCAYYAKDTKEVLFTVLSLSITSNSSVAEAKTSLNMMLKMLGGMGEVVNDVLVSNNQHKVTSLSGIGDEAYLVQGNVASISSVQILFRKDTQVFMTGATALSEEGIPKLEALVRQLAAQL